MEYVHIEVPNLNDSISRVVLNSTVYYIRFQYNQSGDSWFFSLYDHLQSPIIEGVRLVPEFPINLFCGAAKLPSGAFTVSSKLERIGREDFINGKAKFIFVPLEFEVY